MLTPLRTTLLTRGSALALVASALTQAPSQPSNAAPTSTPPTTDQQVTLEVRSGGLRIDLALEKFPDAPASVAFVRDHRGSELNWGMTATFEATGTHYLDQVLADTWHPRCTLINDTDDVITQHDILAEEPGTTVCSSTHGADGISTNITALESLPPVSGIVVVTVY